MALIDCPECARQISSEAVQCPNCGFPITQRGQTVRTSLGRHMNAGFEFKSNLAIGSLPLFCLSTGWDSHTGRKRVAKGVVAIGDIAVGVIAIGGLASGGISLGGLSIGLAALGGAAIGGVAVGGIAIGACLAFGGCAIGYAAIGGFAVGKYAAGGAAFGAHVIAPDYTDPEAVKFFREYLGDAINRLVPGIAATPESRIVS